MKLRWIILICIIIFLIFFHISFLRYLNIDQLEVEGNIPKYDPTKRVAICISGQFRDIEECLQNHKCLSPLNADIFIFVDDNLKIEEKRRIENFYMPVKCVWDSEDVKPLKQYPINMLRMFKRIYYCDLLRRRAEEEGGFKYDVVVRMRPDLIFKEYLPVGVVNNTPANTLLIPIHHRYDFWWTKIFGPTDMFAVGDSKTMSVYSNCWLNLENLEVDTCPGEKIIFNHYMNDIPNIRTFKYNLVLYSMRFKWDIWSISNIIKTKVIGKKEFWYPSSLQKCVKNNRLSEIKIKFLDI